MPTHIPVYTNAAYGAPRVGYCREVSCCGARPRGVSLRERVAFLGNRSFKTLIATRVNGPPERSFTRVSFCLLSERLPLRPFTHASLSFFTE